MKEVLLLLFFVRSCASSSSSYGATQGWFGVAKNWMGENPHAQKDQNASEGPSFHFIQYIDLEKHWRKARTGLQDSGLLVLA